MVIWAVTSAGYFWPIWVALPLGAALAIHGWFVMLAEQPALVDRFRGSRTLARPPAWRSSSSCYLIAIWAITGHGYFWPVWPILAIARDRRRC